MEYLPINYGTVRVHDGLGSTLKNFQDKFDQLFKEVNSINENINVFRRLINELSDKYQDVDALKSLESKFESSVKAYQNSCESLRFQKDAIKMQTDSHSKNLDMINSDGIEMQQRLDTLESDFHSYKIYHDQKIRSMQDSYVANVDTVRKEFQNTYENLKKELVVSPLSVFDQNNDLLKKLESASLDGTNAMLKVNNMDMHIRIIEKKIENLSILIKKVELQGQL